MLVNKFGLIVPCIFLFSVSIGGAATPGDADEQNLVDRCGQPPGGRITLPSGDMITVTEGDGEPRSSGSYSIRLYSTSSTKFLLENFSAGLIRPREGCIEQIALIDLDRKKGPELVVIFKGNGMDSTRAADAFALPGGDVQFLAAVTGLSQDIDPVDRLRSILPMENETENKCHRISKKRDVKLPEPNTDISLNQIKNICISYELPELWAKIEKDTPPKPFRSDGCSLWFKSWKGVSLYPACFLHDLKYWAGYPDEDIERLIADAELMIDIACLTGSKTMAEAMFQGTRVGGDKLYKQPFSWGFGRE